MKFLPWDSLTRLKYETKERNRINPSADLKFGALTGESILLMLKKPCMTLVYYSPMTSRVQATGGLEG